MNTNALKFRSADSFREAEQSYIEASLRSALGLDQEASAERLVLGAMAKEAVKPRDYPDTSTALVGKPMWFNRFYSPDVANIIGFVHAAVGARFKNDQLKLSTFQRPDATSELPDRELLAVMDELNEHDRQPSFGCANIGKHPTQIGVSLEDVKDMWHIQLHFTGHPGPQNFFSAVSAVRKYAVQA